jgi:hypothetical protein
MTGFIRGARTAERTNPVPAARKTPPNAVVKLASRSSIMNFTRVPASARPMSRFRACRTARAVFEGALARDRRVTTKVPPAYACKAITASSLGRLASLPVTPWSV